MNNRAGAVTDMSYSCTLEDLCRGSALANRNTGQNQHNSELSILSHHRHGKNSLKPTGTNSHPLYLFVCIYLKQYSCRGAFNLAGEHYLPGFCSHILLPINYPKVVMFHYNVAKKSMNWEEQNAIFTFKIWQKYTVLEWISTIWWQKVK